MYGGLFGDLPAAKNDPHRCGNEEAPIADPPQPLPVPSQEESTNPIILSTAPPKKASQKMMMVPRKMMPTRGKPRMAPSTSLPAPVVWSAPIDTPDAAAAPAAAKAPLFREEAPLASSAFIPMDPAAEPTQIVDPYDPLVPNDVLAYWDRQAALRQQQLWIAQQEQARQDQAALRAAQLPPRRGERGVNNAPAWLVAQQQKEEPPPI